MKRESDPIGRLKQSMFAESLRRSCIITIFTDSHAEIVDRVQKIALEAYRPIIGFSGAIGRIPDGVSDEEFKDTVPPGMNTTAQNISNFVTRRERNSHASVTESHRVARRLWECHL